MIDPLDTWKNELADLPLVADSSWSANFAGWYADRIANITTDPLVLDVNAGFLFTFPEALFAVGLSSLTPTTDATVGITAFANAWESAILGLVYPVTLNVLPGAFIPPSSPATLFSVVTGVAIDPPSIVLAKAKIIELASAPLAADPQDSEFPEKFRDATLLLTLTVTGINSVAPTPQPLVVPNIPLT